MEACEKILRGGGFDFATLGLQELQFSNKANFVAGRRTESSHQLQPSFIKSTFTHSYPIISLTQPPDVEEIKYCSTFGLVGTGLKAVPKYGTAQINSAQLLRLAELTCNPKAAGSKAAGSNPAPRRSFSQVSNVM